MPPTETDDDFAGTERFQIIRRIGVGGMGVVYEARDVELDLRVALKLLPNADAPALFSFKREFRSLATIVHQNLVALHELISDGATWFFTMEIVDGVDFLKRVRANETTDYNRLVDALYQITDGVSALHELGVLHRDLKPSNVSGSPRWTRRHSRLRPHDGRRRRASAGRVWIRDADLHGARTGTRRPTHSGRRLVRRRRDAVRGDRRPAAVHRLADASHQREDDTEAPRLSSLVADVPTRRSTSCALNCCASIVATRAGRAEISRILGQIRGRSVVAGHQRGCAAGVSVCRTRAPSRGADGGRGRRSAMVA